MNGLLLLSFEDVIAAAVDFLDMGRVVIVAPIAASYPVWSLIQSAIFLRDVEAVNGKVVMGIMSVVAGNFAIHFGR